MAKTEASKYKKLTHREHILHRPDTYLGSRSPKTDYTHVVNNEGVMVYKEVTYNPALIKIVSEIISNSVDESKRPNTKLTSIDVTINKDTGEITCSDDGGIPVIKSDYDNMLVPELIFGNLMSGSNYDDTENRAGQGRNGLGSKLTIVFSESFTVDTADGKKSFTQTFNNNMLDNTKPVVKRSKKRGTTISFLPDYEKLGTIMDNGNYLKLSRLVYDAAGCNENLKVTLNGKEIKIDKFKDYVKMFEGGSDEFAYESTEHWKVGIAASSGSLESVSFCNGTETSCSESTHVQHVANQIVDDIRNFIKKKHKFDVKPAQIKNSVRVYCNATVYNPAYSSQTKETLITASKDFGTEYNMSDKMIATILKLDVVQNIVDWVEAKQLQAEQKELAKKSKEMRKGSVKHIVKLADAVSKNRQHCTLFLGEGDSASTGLIGGSDRNYVGVFSLKGKPISVHDTPLPKTFANEEFTNLMAALGANPLGDYDAAKLRYGKVVLASDADADGASICQLTLSIFNKFLPEMLKEGRLYYLRTPVFIVTPKKGEELEFFSIPDFEAWEKKHPKHTGKVLYIKGLGSLSSKRFKRIFENLENYLVQFKYDETRDKQLFDMLFNNKRSDDRKEWLDLLEG